MNVVNLEIPGKEICKVYCEVCSLVSESIGTSPMVLRNNI